MEKNFVNFDPKKILLKLAQVVADQQGIKAPKVELKKFTYKGKVREEVI